MLMKLKEQAKFKKLIQNSKDQDRETRKMAAELLKTDPCSSAIAVAQIYINEDWHEAAIACFDKALKYCRGNPWWILERKGHMQRKLQQYEEAIATLKKSLHNNPKNAWAHIELGECLRIQGHNQWALDTFEAALRLEPNQAWALERKGRVLRSLGRFDEAISTLNKVVNGIHQSNAYAWSELGESYRKKGFFNEALNAQEKAISINQNFISAWERKGLVLYLMCKFDESRDALKKAKRIYKHSNMHDSRRKAWIDKKLGECIPELCLH